MADTKEQEMQKRIDALEKEVRILKERLACYQNHTFGRRTETKGAICPDLEPSLFDEAETEAKQSVKEPPVETVVKAHTRKKKNGTAAKEALDHLPQELIEEKVVTLPEDKQSCDHCGHKLFPVGTSLVREEVEFIPARIRIIRYMRTSYECRECKKNDVPTMVKPAVPQPVIPHSFASPSLVSHVMVGKYVNAVPLYRQEKEWHQMNLPVSRATLANWIIIASKEWLEPLCDRMHTLLLQEPCIHADETPVQVLNEKGRKNTSKSYMWVYASGEFEALHAIRLFEYSPTRKGENARKYLDGYTGFLHTDDYAGYNLVPHVKRCLCWAHARRKFVEATVAGIDPETETLAKEGLTQIGKLFKLEQEFKELSAMQRQEERQKRARPILDDFWQWAEKSRDGILPKSKLSNALNYALTNRVFLETYLNDGKCAISNNLAENSIRPFTVGRKNWLFSGSPKGAAASARVYSVIETCKANGLNPEKYLTYLFKHMPNETKLTPEILDTYMPWNPAVQAVCK